MSAQRAELRVRAEPTGFVADTLASSLVDGPGNRFVVFLQGCDFDCVACHNPQTIPGHAPLDGHQPQHRTIPALLDEVRSASPFIRGVTVSGGEATQQPDFLRAFFEAVKADPELGRLTCFVDSNAGCDLDVWEMLAPVIDGVMVDLKCLDPRIHLQMTGQPNDRVLTGIEHLHERGLLHEVRLLIIDGVNDDPVLIERTGYWLAAVDPTMRLKVIGFRSHGSRPHDPPLVEPDAGHLRSIADRLRSISDFDVTVI